MQVSACLPVRRTKHVRTVRPQAAHQTGPWGRLGRPPTGLRTAGANPRGTEPQGAWEPIAPSSPGAHLRLIRAPRSAGPTTSHPRPHIGPRSSVVRPLCPHHDHHHHHDGRAAAPRRRQRVLQDPHRRQQRCALRRSRGTLADRTQAQARSVPRAHAHALLTTAVDARGRARRAPRRPAHRARRDPSSMLDIGTARQTR